MPRICRPLPNSVLLADYESRQSYPGVNAWPSPFWPTEASAHRVYLFRSYLSRSRMGAPCSQPKEAHRSVGPYGVEGNDFFGQDAVSP
jgi:hypothetical protein